MCVYTHMSTWSSGYTSEWPVACPKNAYLMVTVEISMLCISYHNDEKCLFVEPSSGGSDSVSLRCSPEHSSVNKAIQLIPEGSRSGTLENLQVKLYGTHTYTCIFFSSRKFIVFISLSKMFMTHKMPRTVPMKPGSRPPGCIPAGGGSWWSRWEKADKHQSWKKSNGQKKTQNLHSSCLSQLSMMLCAKSLGEWMRESVYI